MCCRGVHGVANPAYISRFLFSALPHVAPYCAPGGVRVVSGIRALALPRFRAVFLVPATLSKRGIPPFHRFKLLFG
jgi:hypothetical protein